MEKIKEKIGEILFISIIIIMIGGFIYTKFFEEPKKPTYMSIEEQKELEQKLIDRYGSIENAEDVYREQINGPSDVGHPLWNN
ncbi:MAG: hypothetical protein PHQ18_01980 [Patescibacteria group bacterium]|nr:hypothetical protein [Patescibacteria group bacterium]